VIFPEATATAKNRPNLRTPLISLKVSHCLSCKNLLLRFLIHLICERTGLGEFPPRNQGEFLEFDTTILSNRRDYEIHQKLTDSDESRRSSIHHRNRQFPETWNSDIPSTEMLVSSDETGHRIHVGVAWIVIDRHAISEWFRDGVTRVTIGYNRTEPILSCRDVPLRIFLAGRKTDTGEVRLFSSLKTRRVAHLPRTAICPFAPLCWPATREDTGPSISLWF
jgi:hypothetical protein